MKWAELALHVTPIRMSREFSKMPMISQVHESVHSRIIIVNTAIQNPECYTATQNSVFYRPTAIRMKIQFKLMLQLGISKKKHTRYASDKLNNYLLVFENLCNQELSNSSSGTGLGTGHTVPSEGKS